MLMRPPSNMEEHENPQQTKKQREFPVLSNDGWLQGIKEPELMRGSYPA